MKELYAYKGKFWAQGVGLYHPIPLSKEICSLSSFNSLISFLYKDIKHFTPIHQYSIHLETHQHRTSLHAVSCIASVSVYSDYAAGAGRQQVPDQSEVTLLSSNVANTLSPYVVL